jgi:hypothetical protein
LNKTRADIAREWRQRYPAKTLLYDARRRSKMRGTPCTLELPDVEKVISGWTCVYCDSQVGTFTGGQRAQSATLDRLIPELGYTPANTVLACHSCNSAKSEHTPATLRAWADRIEAIIQRQNPTETPTE